LNSKAHREACYYTAHLQLGQGIWGNAKGKRQIGLCPFVNATTGLKMKSNAVESRARHNVEPLELGRDKNVNMSGSGLLSFTDRMHTSAMLRQTEELVPS
jgi:hypothetical protein